MAEKVMPMKMMAAVVAVAAGAKLNVSGVCREAGCSRRMFYKYVHRVLEEGTEEGLRPRSRRPHAFPRQTSPVVEDAIVRQRKELDDAGLDHGATTIQWHLGRDDTMRGKVPSVATIHRVLVRRGLVFAQPEKRPKASWRRFEAPAPNEWWQVDFFDWVIATGVVHVFDFLDDHSRVAARSRAVEQATTEEATTFCQACEHWGVPAGMLSDNGLQFSGKLRGFEVYFETKLREAGVRPFTGRAYHPQTTGKVERFQQTVKKWLRRYDERHGVARDLAELQARLDEFCQIYNYERPHQGIGRVTPFSRWQASPKTTPSPTPLPAPQRSTRTRQKVRGAGVISVVGQDLIISVGVRWLGRDATVVIDPNDWATVMVDGELVRHFKIDRSHPFQPIGNRRGRGGGTPRQPHPLQS